MDTLENRLQKRMHVSLYALLFLTVLLGLSILLEGCTDSCDVSYKYTYYEPVYTTLDELRSSVEVTPPQVIQAVGKIYIKDDFLFINEPGKGIHIVDNHNRSAPQIKYFLSIPGNYDMAVMGNTLYADSYIDLVAFDIEHTQNIKEVNRIEGLFSNYNALNSYVDPNRGVITDWAERKDIQIRKTDCQENRQPWGGIYYMEGIAFADGSSFNKSLAIAPGTGSGPGVGGSMARFTINNNYLYALDAGNIQPVDISNPELPLAKDKMHIGWDIETIFPHQKNLFIGSSSGMHILDVSAPATPVKISTYAHIQSCDPVVVNDKYAYVTLRSGTTCQGFTNQLEVIDISDLESPKLLKTYPMTNPHGLGIDDNVLFICDGDAGLKIFNAEDINTIDKNLLAHYNAIEAYDVIPFNDVLMMTGKEGIFQYDYSDLNSIKALSFIPVIHD